MELSPESILGAIWVVNYPFSPAQQHIPRELAVLANHMDTIPSTHPHIAPRCYPSVDGLSHTRMGGTGVFSRPFSRVDGELPITSCTTYSQRDGSWNIWQYYEATKLWIKVSMEWIVKRLIRLTLKWVITGNPTEKKSSLIHPVILDNGNFLHFLKFSFFCCNCLNSFCQFDLWQKQVLQTVYLLHEWIYST